MDQQEYMFNKKIIDTIENKDTITYIPKKPFWLSSVYTKTYS